MTASGSVRSRPDPARKVVVTGIGCVSGLGPNAAVMWRNAMAGVCAIQSITKFAEGGSPLQLRCLAAPADPSSLDALERRFGRRSLATNDRFANLAGAATLEALEMAGLADSKELADAAIIYGSASGGNTAIEAGFQRLFEAGAVNVNPRTVTQTMTSAAASHLSMLFGVKGLCYAIASACASSAHAVCEGMHFIRSGRGRVVITGGADASLTYGLMKSWSSLRAVTEDACRPFSRNRSGTAIGEGAATLILEEENHARARGATILAEICGSGTTSDAEDPFRPSAESAARAIRLAHCDAGIDPGEPVLISAHGTGTLLNDRSETAALRSVYGANLQKNIVIATKSAHGHLLGAAGAIELILGLQALRNLCCPPVLGYLGPDPECDLPLVLEARTIDTHVLLSSSFAFGGLNCVIIARRAA